MLGGQADLEAIRTALLQRQGALINVTADERTLAAADPHITAFLDSLPSGSGAPDLCDWEQRLPSLSEALTVPTQVLPTAPFATLLSSLVCMTATSG